MQDHKSINNAIFKQKSLYAGSQVTIKPKALLLQSKKKVPQ